MWGREMRAGLVFVLVSLLVGGAFREWRARNESRFSDLVSALERQEDERTAGGPPDATPPPDTGTVARTAGASRTGAALRPGALEVDRATAVELERLPGIGPALAARIVADRERRGAFGTPERLERVPGIGPKILDRIRPYFATPPPIDSVSPNAN